MPQTRAASRELCPRVARPQLRGGGAGITAPQNGDYTLVTESDDRVRVWVDGAPVIDDWNPRFVTHNEGTVMLPAGQPVAILVEYFEIDGALYMFNSGNVYDHRYRTGVARAPSMAGPVGKKSVIRSPARRSS